MFVAAVQVIIISGVHQVLITIHQSSIPCVKVELTTLMKFGQLTVETECFYSVIVSGKRTR